MTLPFNLFQPFTDRTFGSANPLDTRSPNNSHFSKPLPPIKVTAKRPSWRDITSGKVDQARATIGARTAPTPQEIAEQLRAKAREAYASTEVGLGDVALAVGRAAVGGAKGAAHFLSGDFEAAARDADPKNFTPRGGEFTRRAFRGAAYADLATAGALSAFDPTITAEGVGETVQQFTDISDDKLGTAETLVPTAIGVLVGNTAALMTGSRAVTKGAEYLGREFGMTRLANAGKTLEAMREAKSPLSLRAAIKSRNFGAMAEAASAGTEALASRAAGELLPAIPINLAQGAMSGDEGGALTVAALRKLGLENNADFLETKKGRVFGALENQALDVLGFGALEGLRGAVRASMMPVREIASGVAGAGIGAYTDDEDRVRGALTGGVLGIAGARADEAIGLSTRIVNGIDVGVVAPFKAYSKGLLAVAESKQTKGDAGFWRATLLKGTRKAELDDTGMLQWLDQQSGTLTREQVAAEMRARMPVLGADDRGMTGEAAELYARESALIAKYHKLAERNASETNPTAQRSLRAQMRDVEEERFAIERALKNGGHKDPVHEGYVIPGQNDNYGELVTTKPPASYHEPVFTINTHWPGTENPIAHSRVSERVVDGERALVVHDLQSDAHQIARDQGGYADEAYRAEVEAAKARIAAVQAERDKLVEEWQAHEWKVKTEFDTESIRSATDASRNALREEWRARINAKVAELAEREPALARVPISAQENFARSVLEEEDPSFKALGTRLMNHPTGNDAVQTAVWKEVERRMPDFTEREDALVQAAHDAERMRPAPRRVPDLPFKKTAQWTELQLKRVIEEAQKRGIDRVILPTGEQANKMFSLSKAADELTFRPESGMFEARKNGSVVHAMQVENASELHPIIGRELTEKLLASPQAAGSPIPMNVLRGEDLEVGGAGMKAYYGGIVPPTIKDYAKKLGVKIELEKVGSGAAKEIRPGLLQEKAAAQAEYRRAVDELREARAAREQMDTSDYQAVDAANQRIRDAADRVTDTDFYAKRLEQEYRGSVRVMTARDLIADNLSFRITPEMKAAIKDGQPLWALGALSLAGDDRDDKSKIGALGALAVGAMSRNILHGVPAKALAKMAPNIRRMVESLDPETGYAPAAYAVARQMREKIATIGRNPERLLEQADTYKQFAASIRQGLRAGDLAGPAHEFTADLAERFALGMTVLAEASKTTSSEAIAGERTVLDAHRALAAERIAANPDLVRIAQSGTHDEQVAAVVDYMQPLLERSLRAAIVEHGTEAKWYDQAIRNMGAMATLVMPELSDPHLFALFNYSTSILSNGNPVSPELAAGIVVFQQYLRTGKFSIFHIDDATKQVSHAIEIESSNGPKMRPIFAVGDDGDVLKGGPKFNSWEASLRKLNELIASHDGDVPAAVRELMDRGVTPTGRATKGDSKDRLRATQLFGPKVGQYGTDKTMWMRAQLDHPFPEGVIENATNDLWMARGYNAALGQTPIVEKFDEETGKMARVLDDSVSGPMHRVLNDVQRQLGERVGTAVLGRPLEARNVQALLWEGMKRESLQYGAGAKAGAFDTMETAMTNYLFGSPGTRSLEEVMGLAQDLPRRTRFAQNLQQSSRPGYLTPVTPQDLAGKRVTLLHGDRVGYVLDEYGDLQGLYNNGAGKGKGTEAALHAIANGAATLDAYDGYLPKLYAQLGFVETGRMKFNPEYAPPGWDVVANGEPDVVFMAWHGFPDGEEAARARALGPVDQWTPHDITDRYFDDYAEAQQHNRRAYAEGAGASGRAGARVRSGVGDAARGRDLGAGAPAGRTLKNRRGAVSPGALGALGGGAAGGAAGAFVGAQADAAMGQDVSTREGAVAGLLGGLVAGAGGGGVMLHRLPGVLAGRSGTTLLSRSADVAQVVQTIAHGARTLNAPPSVFGSGVGQIARRAYAALVDDVYALRRLGRQVAGDAPLSGLDAQLRQSQRWITWADQRLQTQLRPVLEAARGREQDVMALVKVRRDMDLRAQGVAVKTDLPDDVLARARAELEQDERTVAAADALQDYYRGLLDWKLDERLHTQDSYDAIVASEDYYTPFLREWEQEGLKGDGAGGFVGGGKTYNRGNGTRKLDRQQMARAKTVDPFEIAVMDTQKTAQLVGKQRVMQMISGMVEANGGEIPGVLKRVPKSDAPDPLGRRFDAIVNGQQVTYEVLDPDVFKAIQSFGPKTQVPAILKAIKEFKRAAITTLPDFAVRNLIRDNAQVAVGNPTSLRGMAGGAIAGAGLGVASAANEPGDMEWNTAALRALSGAGVGTGAAVLVPQLARTMRGVTDIMAASRSPLAALIGRTTGGDAAVWTQFLTDGAASIGHYARDLRDARNVLQTLRGDRARVYNPRRWYEGLEALGSTLENAPRLATYKTALEGGASRPEAAALAADVSLDFSRKGGSPFQQGLNETNAFLNARVQGWDKMGRMLRDPRTWAVGAATLTAPSIGNWIAIHQDDQSRESYYEHPSWMRNTFWLVPTGGGDFLYIPKPFELGTVFASIPERFLDWMYAKQTKADARPGESAAHTAKELLSSVVATDIPITDAAKPILEQAINYDFFRNRPIVSSETYSSAKTLPEFQTDDRTSKVARYAGERFGWSPQRVDHLIGAYGGSAGKVALRALDEVLPGENTSPTAGRAPIVGDLIAGFTDRKGQTSDAEVTVRRRYDHLQRVENALKPLLKLAEDESADPARRDAARQRALVLVEQNAKDIGAEGEHLDGLKAATEAINDLRDEARAVQRTPGMPVAERKAQLEALQQARAQIAKLAVAGRYDEIAALVAQWTGAAR